MERHVSDKAMNEFGEVFQFLGLPLMDRSLEKWKAGMRTRKQHTPTEMWPFMFQGRPMTGDFLVSSYSGGRFTVVTTASDQWLVLTEELDQGQFIQGSHSASSRTFSYFVKPGRTNMPDGSTRHAGGRRRGTR